MNYLLFQDFSWIEADESQVHMHEPKLTPLKGMSSPVFKVSTIHVHYHYDENVYSLANISTRSMAEMSHASEAGSPAKTTSDQPVDEPPFQKLKPVGRLLRKREP